MSQEAVEAVIGKALLNAKFRTALLANPDQALAVFDLSRAEIAKLKRLDVETLDVLADWLDEQGSEKKLNMETSL
jgi:hypothetical protein